MCSGKGCSRAVALRSFKPQDINGNLEGLDDSKLAFLDKYPKVGQLVLFFGNWSACSRTMNSANSASSRRYFEIKLSHDKVCLKF